jgi:hypothetical protein
MSHLQLSYLAFLSHSSKFRATHGQTGVDRRLSRLTAPGRSGAPVRVARVFSAPPHGCLQRLGVRSPHWRTPRAVVSRTHPKVSDPLDTPLPSRHVPCVAPAPTVLSAGHAAVARPPCLGHGASGAPPRVVGSLRRSSVPQPL